MATARRSYPRRLSLKPRHRHPPSNLEASLPYFAVGGDRIKGVRDAGYLASASDHVETTTRLST
jgi:hypothetical protein